VSERVGPEPAPEPEPEPERSGDPISTTSTVLADFQAGRLVLRAIFGAAGLLGALAVSCTIFKAEVLEASAAFVDVGGGLGIWLAWTLLDLVPFPFIPQDVFSTLGVLGGLGFWESAAWAFAGSLTGGLGSWFLSRRVAHLPLVRRALTRGAGQRLYDLAHRHGAWALAAGAVSPLPYGLAAWCCGAAELRLRTFVLVSLLRGPRILFYLWLFERGAVNALA
jgi:uncharacterized membrane protein YdjX (TVP38/TMEM64 family)